MKWDSIETFFLDMDGTLLDLAYDNYFWHEHIPYLYAKKNNITFKSAKKEFEKKYKEKQNTIEWYSIDYWSDILKIDLAAELIITKNRINIFPGVTEFILTLKKHNIQILLLTNCPRKMLNVKLTQTKLWGYFDKIISSQDFGFIKESDIFWSYVDKEVIYNKEKTIFIDDNQDVLKYAIRNGIKNVIAINSPDSNKKNQVIEKYISIDGIDKFNENIINLF